MRRDNMDNLFETFSSFDGEPNIALIQSIAHNIPYSFAKEHLVLPLDNKHGCVILAVARADILAILEELRLFLKTPFTCVRVKEEKLHHWIELCYNVDRSVEFESESSGSDEGRIIEEDLLTECPDAPIVEWLHAMIREGLQRQASDIHFEPLDNEVQVRFRLDGVLQARHMLPKSQHMALVTRLKVMARIDIAEQRLPQDGRIKLRLGQRPIDIRLSTIPTVCGERVVLRLLDQQQVRLDLNHLHMPKVLLEQLLRLIKQPEGMILVTGPTGSGKTTTLYSAIASLDAKECNIMTIEDPVEYKLDGIAQMNVQPKIGLTFATGLRHLLRQDPDILLIGEIRDQPTAEIATQASLTGHLVLSTLHTNDAPSALPRLVDMGIEPYLLAASLTGVLAQRLVRLLCPFCKRQKSFEEGYEAVGCPECLNTGYKGRRAIYEMMHMTPAIQRLLAMGVDALKIKEVALSEGMIPLAEDGKRLISSGETSLEEILRVVK